MTPDTLIPASEVRAMVGNISAMTLHRWLADGTFPPPIYLRKRRYWHRSAVSGWLAERATASTRAEHAMDHAAAADRAAYARSCREHAAA